ncbi:MAG: hypothetical protein ACFCD0_22380 [Gemmataceae bacterium]
MTSLSWIPLLGGAMALGISLALLWRLNQPKDGPLDDTTALLFTLRYNPTIVGYAHVGFVVMTGFSVFLLGLLAMWKPTDPSIVIGLTLVLGLLPLGTLLVYAEVISGRLDVSQTGIENVGILGKKTIPWRNVKEVRVDWQGLPYAIESLKFGTIWIGFFEGLDRLSEQIGQHVSPNRVVLVSDDGHRKLLADHIDSRNHIAPDERYDPPADVLEKIETVSDVNRKVDRKIYLHAESMRRL